MKHKVRHKYFWIAGLLALLVLNACKVGKNFQGIEVKTPEEYRFVADSLAGDSLALLKWWELFDDPILDTLITGALENNRNVLAAAQNVEAARYRLGLQRGELGPKFNIAAQASTGNFLLNGAIPGQNNLFVGGLTVNWEIDFWGKFRRLSEAAKGEYLASEYGLRSLQIALISQVAQAYFQLLQYRASLEISEQTLALRDSSLQIVQQRFDEGYTAAIDLNQAKIQYAIAASAIPRYQRLVYQTENLLSVLVGQNPKAIGDTAQLVNQAIPPDIPVGMPAQLLRQRPDVAAAESQAMAANAYVGAAIAQRFPSISLSGFLGVANTDFSQLFSGLSWNVGGSLLAPLFYWNQNLRRVDIQRALYAQSVFQYEQVVLEAYREVEDALIAIETLKDEVEARQMHVEAALNAQALSKQRYEQGVTSFLEYLESQRQAFEAQIFLVEVQQLLLNSYVDLYRALGGGWLSREEETAAQQDAQE